MTMTMMWIGIGILALSVAAFWLMAQVAGRRHPRWRDYGRSRWQLSDHHTPTAGMPGRGLGRPGRPSTPGARGGLTRPGTDGSRADAMHGERERDGADATPN
jgi:hypothetical protein